MGAQEVRIELGWTYSRPPTCFNRVNYQGREYVSYSQLSDLSACAFDFGNNGYAASSNQGGELLQMTARSDKHGIIFARGDFEYSLYLALARGQKEQGGKSAFGLKVATSDGLSGSKLPRCRPCCMIDRGCYNYRWPFNEFCFHVDSPGGKTGKAEAANGGQKHPKHCICPAKCADTTDGAATTSIGTYSILSFVKDDILYQVLRLSPRCGPHAAAAGSQAELTLTIESPMRLQSFSRLDRSDSRKQEVALEKWPSKHHPHKCPYENRHTACLQNELPDPPDPVTAESTTSGSTTARSTTSANTTASRGFEVIHW